MNWSAFYEYWDDFVGNWYASGANPNDAVSLTFRNDSGFTPDWDELPEPYQGRHEGARAVVINYNPGAAGSNESVKSYRRRDDPAAFLMHDFAHQFNGRYTAFQQMWSELNEWLVGHNPKVPGVCWWQRRCKWFKRFFNMPNLVTSKMFALEMCPYHSLYWNGQIPENLDGHYREHVFGPAFAAVVENGIPCVVCVGKKIGTFLMDHFHAVTVSCWKDGIGPDGRVLQGWPQNRKGRVHRTYELLEVPVADWGMNLGVDSVKCLILSAPGSNCLPSRNFAVVESDILEKLGE